MEITTWTGNETTYFVLDLSRLKAGDGKSTDMPIEGKAIARPEWCKSASGTRILLRELKHKTPPDIPKLTNALARRFSSRIRGEMTILVNGNAIGEPLIELDFRFPEGGEQSETLPNGKTVTYHYAFAKETIKTPELRGFTIYVRGRTAQAPPFFFDVEGTASGQHSTKYVTGAIEADFLDEGLDDASDVISTDRQHIDWELPQAAELRAWGEALARKALRDCAEAKGTRLKDWLIADAKIAPRLEKLEKSAKDQIGKFLVILGKAEPDEVRALELADSLVQAYEYRHFHDVIGLIENASNSDDPQDLARLLSSLQEWKVLESRAILEIVKGRIGVIDRFQTMVVNDAPETKSKLSDDNLHDLIAGYPWLLNPEWQVLSEEKKISTQLREWGQVEVEAQDEELRYDFLALSDERRLVIVEIKRSGHPVDLEELQRLDLYRERLTKSENKEISIVLVYGGTVDVSPEYLMGWTERPHARLMKWSELHSRNRTYYEHYRAVLERDIENPSFDRKEREVISTRKILAGESVHRNSAARKEGLGPQDVDWRQNSQGSGPQSE
jgi:hypothetical protein